jgi:hypothetical protein
MSRLPIRELIVPKKRPQTTLSLVPAFQKEAKEMVETYIFTNTIRDHFDKILDSVARGHGQGFWVQAEYGAGKTHFLVVLAALLSGQDGGLWDLVGDEEIRNFRHRLGAYRLFPVVVSLRGEGSADSFVGRSLLDVLLEEGFQRSLEHAGLADQVQVTAAEDLLTWLQTKASQGIRREAEEFVRKRVERPLEAYRDHEGVDAAGRLIAEYCTTAGIKPEIASSIKARLAHIYRQLTETQDLGYDGLLMVVDEYEGWQKHHNTEEELSIDAELLETLGYLLPRDLGYRVFTVVASQSSVPGKLHGAEKGDRFLPIPLLAQDNEHDYDVIVSRRVRSLNETRLPEINDHYEYYTQHFAFAQNLTAEQFHDIFPFQPRCFDVVRRITSRDLPTTRSGLSVFWEAVTQPPLLDRTQLIRVADLLTSRHLMEDCLTTTVYKEAYQAYKAASETLDALSLEPGDLDLARDVLATLFLWYLAFMDTPRGMNMQDLAQATLTTDDFMRAEDNVRYVLSLVQALPQIDFDNESAQFVLAGGEGPSIVTLFGEEKRRLARDPYKLQSALSESLFFTPRETGGATGLFNEFPPDEKATRRVECQHLEYAGEVIVATSWRLDQGLALPKEDSHFRLVILTPATAHSVRAADLQDSRIAVVLPGEMSEEARDAAAAYLAWNSMREAYKDKAGRDAEEVRSWLDSQRRTILDTLVGTHLKLYQAGRVITRDNLAISARDAFGRGGGNEARITHIVEQVLVNAYPQLPAEIEQLRRTLTPAEAGKVFAGYFDKDPSSAAKAAVRNYGVALGLSHPDRPDHFAPQTPSVFARIEAMLAEREGAELPVWQLYDRLSATPYGLPYVVIQLYLLAFVRRGAPRVDLLLKARHSLRSRDRQPIGRERLTASTVADMEWKPGLEDNFDALVPALGPTWNDTLGYAREIADDLRATTDQVEIETQTVRLRGALESLQGDVATQRSNLKALASTLAADLPGEAAQALGQLEQLAAEPPAGHADFYEQAEAVFEARPEALRAAMQTFTRLRALGGLAAEIGVAKRYLDDVDLRPTDRDLAADRMTLQAQLSLATLVERPETWERLREDLKRFTGRYQNAYQKHHRDYYAALDRLRGELADAPHQLRALGLLNRIEGLGAPLGDGLEGRYQALQSDLKPCPLTKVTDVSVERAPTCDHCPQTLRLTDTPPEAEVSAFLRELTGALDNKRRQLASEAISRVLARGGGDTMATFLEAVRAADLAALVDVMSPDLADFVERLLADEAILTADADVLARVAQRFPSLEESQLEEAVAEFRRMLREAFAQARQEHPDKKTVRLNLR